MGHIYWLEQAPKNKHPKHIKHQKMSIGVGRNSHVGLFLRIKMKIEAKGQSQDPVNDLWIEKQDQDQESKVIKEQDSHSFKFALM